MKKQREIITNRPLITDSEIETLKPDYQTLSKGFNGFSPKAMLKGFGGWTAGIVGAAIIGVGAWTLATQPWVENNNSEQIETKLTQDSILQKNEGINPPFAALDKMESFFVDNSKPTEILTENGNKIIIPANSFVDNLNKPVKGKVEILFKDYHNPLENFKSGIPMTYDSAGTNYTFESAGMFKIFARQDGENVYLASGKTIEVELVTTTDEIYNQYRFDTLANRWEYLKTEDKSDIQLFAHKIDIVEKDLEESTYNLGQINKEIEYSLQPATKQTHVRKRDKSRFAIKIPQKDYLDEGSDTIVNNVFEIYPDQKFKKEYYSVKWTGKMVKPAEKEGDYIITLVKDDTKLNFKGYLIEDPSIDYSKQIKEAEAKKAKHDELLKKREALMSEIAEKNILQKKLADIDNYGFIGSRRVNVVNLGSYNCDRPIPEPEMAVNGKGEFVDNQGNILRGMVYITQKGKNILWKYPTQSKYKFGKHSQNVAWIVLPDHKVGVLLPNDQSKLSDTKIVMNVLPTEKALMLIEATI